MAQSFERIHRSNLVGMGVLPLQFPDGVTAQSLGLDGTEISDVVGRTIYEFTMRAKITINTTITTSASVALSWPTPPTFIQMGSRSP